MTTFVLFVNSLSICGSKKRNKKRVADWNKQLRNTFHTTPCWQSCILLQAWFDGTLVYRFNWCNRRSYNSWTQRFDLLTFPEWVKVGHKDCKKNSTLRKATTRYPISDRTFTFTFHMKIWNKVNSGLAIACAFWES